MDERKEAAIKAALEFWNAVPIVDDAVMEAVLRYVAEHDAESIRVLMAELIGEEE